MNNEMNPQGVQQIGDSSVGEDFAIPRQCLLEGFAELSAASSGIDLQQLAARDEIHLHTQNSEYHLVLLDPLELRVVVQGGSRFTEPTEAILCGATLGGAMLRTGWIGLGLRLELLYDLAHGDLQSLVTSPVQRLRLERLGAHV